MILCLVFCFCACDKNEENSASSGESGSAAMPTVLEPMEYVLYQNIFYNQMGELYADQEFDKTGTFTVLRDSYNGRDRYYVWGYNDATKCCDWQWEFNPSKGQELPPVGSLIRVKGKFVANDNALDGYWIKSAKVTVKQEYTGSGCDYDLTTMSGTLERVQLQNLWGKPDDYQGKTLSAYGRVAGVGMIQDPYYDGSWTQSFTSDVSLPAIGTMVIISGTVNASVIENCTITETADY